ncbi:hypothetical protein TIFTF001_045496 [Ficus carica]|uniref:Uncharacterized protein n=1 Tax=Ficus carica TaxID=3494 RepID=A0AA87YT91_FICCA|nr:hypothetical protein TIFTF001_045489 [Ficus carica]GMN21419.1 hypothetical protein TIFTF001_045491 [Ficus carica]GMN21430.1 hypothetical protein TIFTF001_045494 [Ficus carica]GMN21437.1 hypothetical protein TIFTF001_045496 [Ficus carica]
MFRAGRSPRTGSLPENLLCSRGNRSCARTVQCPEHLYPGGKTRSGMGLSDQPPSFAADGSLGPVPVSYRDHPPTPAAHRITNHHHLP